MQTLFDGSACLVKGELLELIREELGKQQVEAGDEVVITPPTSTVPDGDVRPATVLQHRRSPSPRRPGA